MYRFLLTIFLMNVFWSAGHGQSVPNKQTSPIRIGERLTYLGELNRIVRGIDIGEMTFSVVPEEASGSAVILSEAKSRGSLTALLRFSFLQRYASYVSLDGKRAIRTTKYDAQRERVRESDALFSYEKNSVTFIEKNPKNPNAPPRTIASELDGDTHDIITAIFFLRGAPLKVGNSFEVPVSDSGLVYRIPVRVTGKEYQKTYLGRVLCVRVEPDVFGAGRFIEQKGSMVIWITDDERRIPVRSQIKTEMGRLEIKLKSYSTPTIQSAK